MSSDAERALKPAFTAGMKRRSHPAAFASLNSSRYASSPSAAAENTPAKTKNPRSEEVVGGARAGSFMGLPSTRSPPE